MDIKIAQQMTITELVLENQKLKQERDDARTAFVILEQERDDAMKNVEYYKDRYEQLKERQEIPKWYNGREIPDIKEETK